MKGTVTIDLKEYESLKKISEEVQKKSVFVQDIRLKKYIDCFPQYEWVKSEYRFMSKDEFNNEILNHCTKLEKINKDSVSKFLELCKKIGCDVNSTHYLNYKSIMDLGFYFTMIEKDFVRSKERHIKQVEEIKSLKERIEELESMNVFQFLVKK